MTSTVTICHFSDWHNEWRTLPEADIYVCTGDMLDNYPDFQKSSGGWGGSFGYSGRIITASKEERLQKEWFQRSFFNKGRKLGLRHWFPKSCKNNPVVVVRGNHDFTNLGPMFGGEVFEVNKDPSRTVEYCGLKFGGFRGIPWIIGEWSDEMMQTDFYEIMERIPNDLDVIVSHCPPAGFLDKYFGEKLGINAYANWINKKMITGADLPKLFCFGHIHNQNGKLEHECGSIFSNAATTKQIIEIKL